MRIYHGWFVLAFCVMMQAVTMGTLVLSFTFWIYPWTKEFNVPISAVMTVYFLNTIACGLLSPVVGRFIDKVPARRLVVAGGILFPLSLFLVSISTALWQIGIIYTTMLSLGFLLNGVFFAQAMVIRWFKDRRGLALGLVGLGPGIGGLIFPQIVARLVESVGWREAHMVLAAIALVLILPLGILVLSRQPPGAATPQGAGSAHGVTPGPNGEEVTVVSILKSRAYWSIVVSLTAIMVMFYGFLQSMRPFTVDLALAATETATLLSIIHLSRMGGNAIFGALSDRVDLRVLLGVISLGVAISIWAMTLTQNYAAMLGVAVMIGLTSGGLTPMVGALCAASFGPAAFGRATGLISPFMSLSAAGVVVIGVLRDSFGSFEIAFRIVVLAMLPFTAAIVFLKTRKASPEPVVRSAAS